MSDFTELPDRQRLQGMPQEGRFWCVPATVASMLSYHGVHVSQTALILAYCSRFESEGPLSQEDGTPVSLDGLGTDQVLEKARVCRLDHANFKHFGEIGSEQAELEDHGLRLRHVDGLSAVDLIAFVTENLNSGRPVGVSAISGPGKFHVCVALGAGPNALRCYDPGLGAEVELHESSTTFAQDVLVLEKTQT